MRLSKLIRAVLCSTILLAPVPAQNKRAQNQPATPPPETPYSNVKRENLLNGLQIVTLERADDVLVKCYIVIRGGAMFDTVGKTGLAALTQRTLLAVNPQLKEELESLQTKVAWGVNWDTTWFHLEGPPNNFEAALEILARLLVVENIRSDAFKRAQAEQIERIKSPLPSAELADEAFHQALYGDHPYGHNIDGSALTVSGLKQGDIYDVFRRFYLANNSSAVVVGRISPERVLRAFKILFGGWSKGAIVPATFRAPAQIAQMKLVKIDDPQAERVEMRGGVLGVKYGSPDFPITQVLARILTQRWSREGVVIEAAPRLLAGPLYFSASAPPSEAQALSQRLTDGLAGLASAAISEEELAAAKRSLIDEFSARPIELWLRDIEAFSLPRNYPVNLKSRLEAITPAEAQRVARKLFAANALTVVVRGPVNDSFNKN